MFMSIRGAAPAEVQPPSPDDITAVLVYLQDRSEAIRTAIATTYKSPWIGSLFLLKKPELWKALGHLHTRLSKVILFIHSLKDGDSHPFPVDSILERLIKALRKDFSTLDASETWEIVHEVRDCGLLLASSEHLGTMLVWEKNRDKSFQNHWTNHLNPQELEELAQKANLKQLTRDEHIRAVSRLATLFAERDNAARHRYAKVENKSKFLSSLWPSFAVLLLLLFAALWGLTGEFYILALTAVSGAIGSRLSGMRKVRDEMTRFEEIRAFAPVVWLQLFVGGALGLLVYTALRTGIVTIPGNQGLSWPIVSIAAFACGFSESLFLGIVEKIVSVAEKEKEKGS